MKKQEFIDELKKRLEIEDTEVNETTVFSSIKGYDSLSVMTLIAMADEYFNKRFSADQIRSLTTVQSLFDLIGNEQFEK